MTWSITHFKMKPYCYLVWINGFTTMCEDDNEYNTVHCGDVFCCYKRDLVIIFMILNYFNWFPWKFSQTWRRHLIHFTTVCTVSHFNPPSWSRVPRYICFRTSTVSSYSHDNIALSTIMLIFLYSWHKNRENFGNPFRTQVGYTWENLSDVI